MRKLLLVTSIALLSFPALAQRTEINDRAAARMLLGRHKLSLQWISWDYFGTATVTNSRGVYQLRGEHRGRGQSIRDYLRLDGRVSSIDTKEFTFEGKIEMRISHINNGEPCLRNGEFTFRITGRRRYWRMQEMDNPCDQATDYVDIYFR
jgi:hypothetical protein